MRVTPGVRKFLELCWWGVGSNKVMSDDTCGVITCMVCFKWDGDAWEDCLSDGMETGESKLRPSKSLL